MNKPTPTLTAFLLALSLVVGRADAADTASASPLAPMAFLAGHCWTAPFPDGKTSDTHCFEWLNGGQQLRDRHVVRGARADYGGETLYYWDGHQKRIAYIYADISGGHSRGHVETSAPRILSFPDDHYIGADGKPIHFVTEWRADADDSYRMLAKQKLSNGALRTALDLHFRRDGVTSRVETQLDGSRALVAETIVNASLTEAWQAFTTSAGWQSWAVPFAVVDFKLGGLIETSYDPNARAGDVGNIHNRILAYAPYRMLAFQATRAPPGFKHADLLPALHSVAEFEPLGANRVRVRLTGYGYAPGEGFDTLLKFFEPGNVWSLKQLTKRFEKGPVDWAEALKTPVK